VRRVTEESRLADVRVDRTSVRVFRPVTIETWVGTFVLPPGEYFPFHEDRRGIFYSAPDGVAHIDGESRETVLGGVYLPREPGRPFTYPLPSLYVVFSSGDVSKWPLSEEQAAAFRTAAGFVHNRRLLAPWNEPPA
jgi:hypothetical protein